MRIPLFITKQRQWCLAPLSLLLFFFIVVMPFMSYLTTKRPDILLTYESDKNIRMTLELNPYRLFGDALPIKKLDALCGDPEAAMAVSWHYSNGKEVWDEGLKWDTIGAENGAMEGQYSLSNMLLNFSNNNSESKTRGLYWLYRMVQVGYRKTEASLNDYGYTLETAQPPDDSSFPDTYAQLSETEIAECRIGALQGNKKAALLLGRYYGEITADNELSEYWYRIGAQNGNPECMFELSQILLGKDDQLDQVRGKFWLDRAAQNGD